MRIGIIIGLMSFIFCTPYSANASLVGYSEYIEDTTTKLDWRKFTTDTRGISAASIQDKLKPGGMLDAWRYASSQEVEIMVHNSYLRDTINYQWPPTPSGLSGEIQFQTSILESLIFTFQPTFWETSNGNSVMRLTGYTAEEDFRGHRMMSNLSSFRGYLKYDTFLSQQGYSNPYQEGGNFGHFLVRDSSVVPVPAAVWLMGSGLLGLLGYSRKRTQIAG